MAYIEVYFHDGRVEHFDLDKSNITIGRSSEADIRIDDPIISRLHGRLDKMQPNRWAITDLDSRNKTYFSDQVIKSHTLQNNDIFYFGSIKVTFHDPSGNSDESAQRTILGKSEPIKKSQVSSASISKQQSQIKPSAKNQTNGKTCSCCKTPMTESAIICTECGYNIETGKTLSIDFDDENTIEFNDNGATVGTTVGEIIETTVEKIPKLKRKEPKEIAKNQTPTTIAWLKFKNIWMPTILLLLGIGINFAALAPLYACASLMGMLFNTVLILFAIAIGTKLGGISLEDMGFGNAMFKILAIASILSIFGSLDGALFILFTLAVLIGTIKFFFDPRMLEWFLIAGVVTIMDFFIVHRNLIPQLRAMIDEMNM
jgi:pSer/pThr/pTyr-binding forkhead associated (FHA) protein